MRSKLRSAVALLLAVQACAHSVRPAAVTPERLAGLEARRAAHPNDPRVLADVGSEFYQAGEFGRARDVLAAALALNPSDFRAAVQLGLAYEGLHDFDAALAAYHQAAAMKVSRNERRVVEEHLVTLTHARLLEQARQAVAAERTIASTPPVANSIAVLPWTYLGADPELRPLERGMAHLVVSDLAKVPRLTLLERERVQAITDELALAGAERVDPATAARSGRLLKAAEVLTGVIRDTDRGAIRLDATVLSSATADVRATGTASDKLAQLFQLEKSLVFDLLDRMSISLSPEERRAISERPTADLQAFLAFSRGLGAEDRGDFRGAAGFFQQAAAADPSFRAARARAASSARVSAARAMTPARLAAIAERRGTSLRGAQLAAALQNIAPSLTTRINRNRVRTTVKSRLAEALRQDDPSRLGSTGQPTGTLPRP